MTGIQKVQAIGMNLSRIGNWVADGYQERQKKILVFLNQTTDLLNSLPKDLFPQKFVQDFQAIKLELENGPKNEAHLAERLLTWGTILNHRANSLKIG